jgi:hypothetical protein
VQTYRIEIDSLSPYSQSKFIDKDETPKIGKENADDYEKRTWRTRIHINEQGKPFMPPMALKKSLEGAAKYLGKIPGQGHATYTKRVRSGILITEQIPLYVGKRAAVADDWTGEWLFLDAQGDVGGKRVKRCMPRLSPWSAVAELLVVDEVLTLEVIEKLVHDAGMLVGVGRFRPESGGFYGRFKVVSVEEV